MGASPVNSEELLPMACIPSRAFIMALRQKLRGDSSQDCRVLNVWTPTLRSGGKRPVMVWLHGGSFDIGSDGVPMFDGTNLSAKHDVVVVGVNHRLNAFGHLYLGKEGGERYADSGNVGMLD